MSVIRVGSTGKYADGWESIFGGSASSGRRSASGKKSRTVTLKVGKVGKAKAAKPVAAKAVKKKAGKKPGKKGTAR